LVKLGRVSEGRKEKTTFCIVDAQSVKNTDCAREKGYDAGKKVSGIKRFIAVDTNGYPHALYVTTANISDKAGTLKMLERSKENLTEVKAILCDGSYEGKPFAQDVMELLGAQVQIAPRNKESQFVVIPKRWIVERDFAWLEKHRRLWKNCERSLHSSLQMLLLAFISTFLRRY